MSTASAWGNMKNREGLYHGLWPVADKKDPQRQSVEAWILGKNETTLRNRKCPTRTCFIFLLEMWKQLVPSQTNNVLGRQKSFGLWMPFTHKCVFEDYAFTQHNFNLYPLHPEMVPGAGKSDLVLPARISYSCRYSQRICPCHPGEKCLYYFRVS